MTAWIAAAQWIAPIATMIAAMMTAANLGARTTGWGFVIFTLGSVCWTAVGVSNGQSNLLAANAFLTLVNLVGIWRWLGHQARYQDGAATAAARSERGAGPSLVAASGVCGFAVCDCAGAPIGTCVEALIDRASGQIDYIVVASRNAVGMDEQLRGVPLRSCRLGADKIALSIDSDSFDRLPVLVDRNWPARL